MPTLSKDYCAIEAKLQDSSCSVHCVFVCIDGRQKTRTGTETTDTDIDNCTIKQQCQPNIKRKRNYEIILTFDVYNIFRIFVLETCRMTRNLLIILRFCNTKPIITITMCISKAILQFYGISTILQ